MAIQVPCAACGAKFQAADTFAGHQVKCPQCSAAITVGEPSPQALGPATPAEEKTLLIPVACRLGGLSFCAKSGANGSLDTR